MPGTTVVNTLVKTDAQQWIALDPDHINEQFTQEEIQTILVPYFTFLKSLPGFVETINTTDGNVKTTKITFDSQENLANAMSVLYGEGADPVVKAKNDLITSKMDQLGLVYARSRTVE